jgi:Transposase DDE domain
MEEWIKEYVQYLAVSQVNFTQTYFGERHKKTSHDQLNRTMREAKVRPRHVWQAARGDVIEDADGYLLFDDTVLNKEYSEKIEIAKRQYSGAEHGIVMGIGVVTCVYCNPKLNRFWIIDFRIYNKRADGKDKLAHVEDMFLHTIVWKKLKFRNVLFDTWYATNHLMNVIHRAGKYFYCPIKSNRLMTQGVHWSTADRLCWDEGSLKNGQGIRLKKQSKHLTVRIHRLARPTRSADESYQYLVTNDVLASSEAVADHVGFRWKVEEFHREVKQNTGIERCECRRARPQRNHVACSMMAWILLKRAAHTLFTTIYQLKEKLLDDCITQLLNTPPAHLKFA